MGMGLLRRILVVVGVACSRGRRTGRMRNLRDDLSTRRFQSQDSKLQKKRRLSSGPWCFVRQEDLLLLPRNKLGFVLGRLKDGVMNPRDSVNGLLRKIGNW